MEGSGDMKQTWRRYIPWGLAAVLAILALVWALWPRSFADFSHMEQATDFYVFTTDFGAGHEPRESRPDREEIGPPLDLLAEASIRAVGRDRVITCDPEEGIYLYHLYFDHVEEEHWVSDARFLLRSDGMLYAPVYIGDLSLGYSSYQLSDCDMSAVDAELQRLLGMSGTLQE